MITFPPHKLQNVLSQAKKDEENVAHIYSLCHSLKHKQKIGGDMKVIVSSLPRRDTFGRVQYKPECQITKSIADINGKKSISGACLEKLQSNGISIEYFGDTDAWLDEHGATRVSVKKKQK